MKGSIFYYISVFLLIVWFLGYIVLDFGNAVHFVFLVAVLLFIWTLFRDYKRRL